MIYKEQINLVLVWTALVTLVVGSGLHQLSPWPMFGWFLMLGAGGVGISCCFDLFFERSEEDYRE